MITRYRFWLTVPSNTLLPSKICLVLLLLLQDCTNAQAAATPHTIEVSIRSPLYGSLPLGNSADLVSEVKQFPDTPILMSASSGALIFSTLIAQATTTTSGVDGKPMAQTPPTPVVTPIRASSGPDMQAPVTALNTAASTSDITPVSLERQVVIYSSPITKAYFAKTGVNNGINVQVWSVFLRKYQIPFQVITAVDKLETTSSSVLVLPSSIALSEREKQAVMSYRARGGSVLASWKTAERAENGSDVGYNFMEKALDVKVVGTTEADLKDDFLLPHGDSPITHHLPAGTRVWLERVKGLYPLRLEGGQTAAQIKDWSRKSVFGKATSTVVFDERLQASGRPSRSVVFGYPEQLWLSADPRQLEAIAYNAVIWLLRQPAAYITARPFPYRSAFVMAVDMTGAVSDVDLAYAKLLEEAGGRGTYYVLNETMSKSASKVNRLKAAGHEVAFLGDRYLDFRGQSEDIQKRRIDSMRKVAKESGVEIAADAGFHAPMDSYDKTTKKLLMAGNFGHLLAAADASEARLPFFAPVQDGLGPTSGTKALIVLPRTQSGPEDSVDNCRPEVGLKPFFNELDLSEKMAGLSVVSLSGKSDLTDAQSAEIFSYLKTRRERVWMATAGQVADWWRERERVSVRLESGATGPRMVVSILPGAALKQAATVSVNLPVMDATLRLVARGGPEKTPRVARLDAWRAAVVLDGLAAGDHQWDMYFDRPAQKSGSQ